ncbi:MAG: hypothetical protein IT495_05785 [Gammaproteobacteria bacterium]|nr:hypothetical protein [Gammaproteobacteria bacterium]
MRKPPANGSRALVFRAAAVSRAGALLLLATFCVAAGAQTDGDAGASPAPERGRFLFDRRLQLGGYLTLRFRDLDGEQARFDLRDASLFVNWKPAERWLVFSELELENAITVDDDRGVDVGDAEAALERLYVEYGARSWLNLRAGKFLTPVGRWNQLHADPLVWTVSRPLVTTLAFANQATGVAAHGVIPVQGGNSIDYIIYVDDSQALDPAAEKGATEDIALPGFSNVFDNAAGAQLRYHFWGDQAELGISYANVDIRDRRERNHLTGVDGRVRWHGAEFTSELVYRASEGREESEWGAYAQVVVPVVDHVFGVFRYERYDGSRSYTRVRVATLGLAWRPRSPLVFKLEYRTGDDNERVAPSGVLASFGIMF